MEATPQIAWAILAGTLAFFVFVAAWMIYWKRHWDWPTGQRTTATWLGIRGTVVLSKAAAKKLGAITPEMLAKATARAAWSTIEAWKDSAVDPTYDPRPVLKHVVCRLMTDTEFDPHGKNRFNATLLHVSKRVGGEFLPLAVVRVRFADRIATGGQPVIHELVHQLVSKAPNDGVPDFDYHHEDGRIWAPTKNSVESRAQEHYLKLMLREGA